ncbi:nuclear export mediator factor NEMF [Trifolium repens]|nr:nuclear export mediator factor NEMF [Trifolium repens]
MWQDEKIHMLPESWIRITSTDCGLRRSFRYPFSGSCYPRSIFLHAFCVSLETSAMIPTNFELVEKMHYLTFRNVQIPSLICHKHFTNRLFWQEETGPIEGQTDSESEKDVADGDSAADSERNDNIFAKDTSTTNMLDLSPLSLRMLRSSLVPHRLQDGLNALPLYTSQQHSDIRSSE